MQDNKKDSYIIKAMGLFAGVQGLTMLLNVIRAKFAALLLGPEGVGLNSIYNETRELIHSTSNFGLDVSGVRRISCAYESQHEAEIEREVALLRTWVITLATFGTLICMFLAQPISYFTFQDFDHTWGYILLSPAIGFSTIACGELAVLKGIRKLKTIASISVINVVLAIIISLPLYYFYRIDGVLSSLVLLCLAQAIAVLAISYRYVKPRFCFSKAEMMPGLPILGLGIAFALAGMVGHLTQLGIRAWFNNSGGLELVGLYNAGYTITMTYGGLIFSSFDSDYFPRLSGIIENVEERHSTVWKQVRLSVIITIPFVILLIVLIPWLIPLLFSHEFDAVITMSQVACLALIPRSFYLPIAYLPLAAGKSKSFLLLESISFIVLAIAIVLCYNTWGLTGAGIGLVIGNVMDAIIVYHYCKRWLKINK